MSAPENPEMTAGEIRALAAMHDEDADGCELIAKNPAALAPKHAAAEAQRQRVRARALREMADRMENAKPGWTQRPDGTWMGPGTAKPAESAGAWRAEPSMEQTAALEYLRGSRVVNADVIITDLLAENATLRAEVATLKAERDAALARVAEPTAWLRGKVHFQQPTFHYAVKSGDRERTPLQHLYGGAEAMSLDRDALMRRREREEYGSERYHLLDRLIAAEDAIARVRLWCEGAAINTDPHYTPTQVARHVLRLLKGEADAGP